MAFYIKGQGKANLGFGEEFMHCPYCGTDSYTDVHVYSTYYHFYWVPISPMTKEMNTVCQHCGGKRFGLIFKKELFKEQANVSRKYRHKWYTYTGMIILGLIVFLVLLSSIARLLKVSEN